MTEKSILLMCDGRDRKVIKSLEKTGPVLAENFSPHGLGVFWLIRRGAIAYRRKWFICGPRILRLTKLGHRLAKLIGDKS